jgi:hypothetical protein
MFGRGIRDGVTAASTLRIRKTREDKTSERARKRGKRTGSKKAEDVQDPLEKPRSGIVHQDRDHVAPKVSQQYTQVQRKDFRRDAFRSASLIVSPGSITPIGKTERPDFGFIELLYPAESKERVHEGIGQVGEEGGGVFGVHGSWGD